MTTDDNATCWRDLADQLTDKERAGLEHIERETQGRLPDAAKARLAEELLGFARNDIEGRLADIAYGDIPAPADATWVGKWEKNLKVGGWSRGLVWREFHDGELFVDIDGRQQCDGTVVREISVYPDDGLKLTGAGARRLAALLTAAADELTQRGTVLAP